MNDLQHTLQNPKRALAERMLQGETPHFFRELKALEDIEKKS